MRTFIQFKDNVSYAYINTSGETEGVEVFTDNPEQFLKKTYNNGVWEDATLYTFAEVNEDGYIIELRRTYYPSEIGNNHIIPDGVKTNWRLINGEWIDPNPIVPMVDIITVDNNVSVQEQTITPDVVE